MCFICLVGEQYVLWGCAPIFKWYIVYIILSFTCLLFVIAFHIVRIMCLLSAFRKTSMEPIKTINSSLCYDFLGLFFFFFFKIRLVYLNMGSFLVICLLLYWDFVMDWQRGRLLGLCVLVLSNHDKLCSFIEFWCFLKLKLKISSWKVHFQHVPNS